MKRKVNYSSINTNSSHKLSTNFLVAYFKITSSCMLSCPFCSQGMNSKDTITFEKSKKVLNKLKKIGVKCITYTGGEPLLHPNIKEILCYGNSLGFEQIIVTNGLLLNKFDLKLFKYVSGIGVSLHGNEYIHDKVVNKQGVFKKVVSNVDYIIDNYPKIHINLNCTLTDNNINYDNIKFMVDFAKERNVRICFGRLNYIGWSSDSKVINPDKYLSIIYECKSDYDKIEISNCIALCVQDEKFNSLNHSCGAGQTMIAIEPNGDVKICASSSYVIGNILKDSIRTIVRNKSIIKFKKLEWLPMSCKVCKKFLLCKGGCHVEGDGLFFENNCDALLIKKYNDIWNKIKNKKLKFCNCSVVRQGWNKYAIISKPIRIVNKLGIEIIKNIDGKTKISDILYKYNNVINCKEFLVLLYIEGFVF